MEDLTGWPAGRWIGVKNPTIGRTAVTRSRHAWPADLAPISDLFHCPVKFRTKSACEAGHEPYILHKTNKTPSRGANPESGLAARFFYYRNFGLLARHHKGEE